MRYTLLLAAALLVAPAASAQRFEPFGLELRPFIGAFSPVGRQHDDFKNATMLGGQAAVELNQFLHLVGSVGWTHGHARFGGISTDVTHIWQYDIGAELGPMYEVSDISIVRPFAGIGGGGRTYDYQATQLGAKTCTAGYGALGTEFQRDLLALRLEARGYASCFEAPMIAPTAPFTPRKQTRWDFATMLGLTYHIR